jgi:hypothetical protein
MSLAELDLMLDAVLATADANLPSEINIKIALTESMAIGVDCSIKKIIGSHTFQLLHPEIKATLSDVPDNKENNQEIASRILNIVEERYPKVLNSIYKNGEKKIHMIEMLNRMIKEVRN